MVISISGRAQIITLNFGNGSFNGWEGDWGESDVNILGLVNINFGTDSGAVDSDNKQHTLISPGYNGGFDKYIPQLSVASPLGNDYVIRLGDAYDYHADCRAILCQITSSARAATIHREVDVTAENAIFTYYLAAVIEDPGNSHQPNDRPFFQASITDLQGHTYECQELDVFAGSDLPTAQTVQHPQMGPAGHMEPTLFINWTPISFNLTPYIGEKVKVNLMSSDCGAGAHLAYAYLDFVSDTAEIRATKEFICSHETSTLTAPIGMKSYTWTNGQGAVVSTNPEITVSDPDVYRCTMETYSDENCSFYLEKEVALSPNQPVAQFIAPTGPLCEGDLLRIEDNSIYGSADTAKYWSWYTYRRWRSGGRVYQDFVLPGTWDFKMVARTAGGCSDTATVRLTVYPKTEATHTPVGAICIDEGTIDLTSSVSHGYWSGTGITDTVEGIFDPVLAGTGNKQVFFTPDDVCPVTSSVPIVVKPRANPEFDLPSEVCNTLDSVQLFPEESGGRWLGYGTKAAQPYFYPFGIAENNYPITHIAGTTCPDTLKKFISVKHYKSAEILPFPQMCPGADSVLIPTLEMGGNWSGNFISDSGYFYPNQSGTGTFSIKYSFNGACGNSDNAIVTVVNSVEAKILPPPTMCANTDSVQLQAANPGGVWSGTGILNSNTGWFSPASVGAGNHQVVYSIDGECPASDTAWVTVSPVNSAEFTAPEMVCFDHTATLLVPEFSGGTWSGNSVNADGEFFPHLAGEGSHTIQYTSSGTCPETKSRNIHVRREFLASVDSSFSPLCYGNCDGKAFVSVSRDGETVWKYLESSPEVKTTGNQIINLCPGENTIVLEDSFGCTSSVVATLSQPIELKPVVTVTPATCGMDNGMIELHQTTGGAVPYTFRVNDNPNAGIAEGLTKGTYTVLISDRNNCAFDTLVFIDKLDPITAELTVRKPSCFGDEDGGAVVTVSDSALLRRVLWSDNKEGLTNYTFAPGHHSALVADTNNCRVLLSFSVENKAPMDITIPYTDTSKCDQQIIGLFAQGITENKGPISYNWSNGHVLDTLPVLTPGEYSVWAMDSLGCRSGSKSIMVSDLAPLRITPINDTTVCVGNPVTVVAKATGGVESKTHLYWIAESDESTLEVLAPSQPETTESYTVVATDYCSVNDTLSVSVSTFATPSLTYSSDLQQGCEPFAAEVSLSKTDIKNPSLKLGEEEIDKFQLSTSLMSGNYDLSISATSKYGCPLEETVYNYMIVHATPEVDILPVAENNSGKDPLEFEADGDPANQYTWLFGNTSISDSAKGEAVSFIAQTGWNSAWVKLFTTSRYGCTTTDTLTVDLSATEVFYIPNAFTPDGDGFNDEFKPVSTGFPLQWYRMIIYDRRGVEVFSTANINEGWNGNIPYSKVGMKSETYVYHITARSAETSKKIEMSGKVTALR